jgi:hypothetical protein
LVEVFCGRECWNGVEAPGAALQPKDLQSITFFLLPHTPLMMVFLLLLLLLEKPLIVL